MSRTILLALTTLALAFASATHTKAGDKKEELAKLSTEILKTLQSFYPVQSTQKGIHAYDHNLADYSSRSVKKTTDKLTDYTTKLYRFRNTRFSADERVDYQLMKANVEIALLDLKRIKWHKILPNLYINEAVDGVYSLMVSEHAPLPERLDAILSRMKAVPKLFESARHNIKNPSELAVDVGLESLQRATRFYQDVSGELMRQFEGRADEILRSSTRAREALNEFEVYLSSLETSSNTSLAIGKDDYDYRLGHEYLLEFDSDSLLRLGESLLARAQQEYTEYRENVENNHQTGRDSLFVPASFDRQDILDYYQWEARQVLGFLYDSDITGVPLDSVMVTVAETPAYLHSLVNGVVYLPSGPFAEHQQGQIFVRPIPEELDRLQQKARYRYVHRRGFAGSLAQEGYPGRFLQVQAAAGHPNALRKWQDNPMMVQGWTLYCEEMMYQAGLYGEEEPAMWLTILDDIRFHAAGIVADVKLHTGRFTYSECVNWMIETLGVQTESDKNYLRAVVRRYLLSPTDGMSPLMGKLTIVGLRDAGRSRDGTGFSERGFYNNLLAPGAIPPALLGHVMGLD
jgi:uncharacterized protein (DUF885 family)